MAPDEMPDDVIQPRWLSDEEQRTWLAWVIAVNPLTYGVAGLRRLLYPGELPAGHGLPGMEVCLAVWGGFCLTCVAIAVWQTSRPHARNTR